MLISIVLKPKNPPNWRMILQSGRDSNPNTTPYSSDNYKFNVYSMSTKFVDLYSVSKLKTL
jgi:hypothetical protein